MKKILALLVAVVMLLSLAACGGNKTASEYTEEVSLGNIKYRIIPAWHSEYDDGEHGYFIGEYKNLNDGAIIIHYQDVEEILERDLKDAEKLQLLFDNIIPEDVEGRKDVTVAGCPGVEFLREENSSDGVIKLRCVVFVVPGGICMIEAGSLEKLNSKVEAAYKGLLETISYSTNGQGDSNDTNDTEEAKQNDSADGIRPEFKEAMDAYEAFYDEYCEILKEYKANPSDLTILGKYTEMLSKLEEMTKAFEAWDEDEMSAEELKYYLDVNNRVVQKMIGVTQDTTTPTTNNQSNAPAGETGTEKNFTYTVLGKNSVEITKYTGTEDTVTIPSEIDGKDVTNIGKSAFENCTTIKKISIWAEIEIIDDSAFKGCTSLKEISIPYETETIGKSAFENCTSLEKVTLWTTEAIGESAFKGCTNLKEISIPYEAKTIGKSAFENCTSLEKVTLWTTEAIEESTFKNCTSLKEISIPYETETIGKSAFENCTSLEEVTLWATETIGESAFKGCTSLKKVTIPYDTESIGSYAFYGCTSLKEAVIWNSDTELGTDVFGNCPNLKK